MVTFPIINSYLPYPVSFVKHDFFMLSAYKDSVFLHSDNAQMQKIVENKPFFVCFVVFMQKKRYLCKVKKRKTTK